MNEVILIGRLARNPELKFTLGEGKAIATFTLAVERKFSGENGEKESDFINCVAWNKSAEVISQYSAQGKLLGARGRLQTRSYVDKEGIRKYVTEVIYDEIICDEIKIVEWDNSDSDDSTDANKNWEESKGDVNWSRLDKSVLLF